jgi:glucose-1-phosphate thymidylyltransferase
MKVVIPLAGFGTRLRPHTFTKPKPLVNVAGKPVLGHILDKLQGLDIEEIVFVVGYMGEQIKQYVDAHYTFPARYVEQKELLGQAHALHLAREYLSGPLIIIFVDTIFEADLSELVDEPADGVIYVKEVEDPRRFGVVIVQDDTIRRLVEKPETMENNLAVIGVYYVKDAGKLVRAIDELIERDIKTKGEYFLADALQLMIDRGARFRAAPVEVWEDCGKPETVLHTNRYLLERSGGQVNHPLENSIIIPPVYIADSARVVESIVGPYVTIDDGSVVERSILQDSIINKGAHIEDAMLQQSLIGDHAVVRGAFERLNVGDSSQIDRTGNGASG